MLIRVSGGNDGIKEYLEKGIKQGREQSRDILDERVILSGDLDLTNSVINMIENKGQERYLHITLSFKEDSIDKETLNKVIEDFEKFTFSAYKKDEYNFYAEAHLPKVKSYIDKSTGETVERFPHVHIVIPEKNLLSGKLLNPCGLYDKNVSYFQAIQEKINRDYSLISPEDNRRDNFFNKADVISRYKGDLYGSSRKDIKEKILDSVINKSITDWNEFKSELGNLGKVTVRNKGKDNEYLNIKINNESKGINLKEPIFSKQFIENRQGAGKVKDSFIINKISEWEEQRSFEIKHIYKASEKVRDNYKNLSDTDKLSFLAKKEFDYQQKYRGSNDYRIDREQSRSFTNGREKEINQRNKPNITRDQARLIAAGRHSVRELSQCPMVQFEHRSTMLLSNNVFNNMERQERRISEILRRDLHIERVREPVNQYDYLLNKLIDEGQSNHVDYSVIKKKLNPRNMLNELSHSHGLEIDKYSIKKYKDGSFRISSGNRNYNVSDFLTKELNLNWNEAKSILSKHFELQKENSKNFNKRVINNKSLWADFKKDYLDNRQLAKKNILKSLSQNYKQEIKDIRDDYRKKKKEIFSNKKISYQDRKTTLSVMQMNKIKAELLTLENYKDNKQSVFNNFNIKELYKDYLCNLASQGNNQALVELRKHQITGVKMNNDINGFSSSIEIENLKKFDLDKLQGIPQSIIDNLKNKRDQVIRDKENFGNDAKDFMDTLSKQKAKIEIEKEAEKLTESFNRNRTLTKLNDLTFNVNKDGSVDYLNKGQPVIKDNGNRIDFMNRNADKETLEIGIRLAIEKYGSKLKLHGSKEYQEKVIEVVAEKGIKVTFTEERLNELLKTKQEEIQRSQEKTEDKSRGEPNEIELDNSEIERKNSDKEAIVKFNTKVIDGELRYSVSLYRNNNCVFASLDFNKEELIKAVGYNKAQFIQERKEGEFEEKEFKRQVDKLAERAGHNNEPER